MNRATVRKWRQREDGLDASHRPHRIHATLTPAQEGVVIELRKTLFLSLDDLLAVTREFINPNVSRSGLDRCLRRYGVSHLQALIPQPEDGEKLKKSSKEDEPGFVHVDVKYLPEPADEAVHQYLFVAIDRASRWVYVEMLSEKSVAHAAAFLQRLVEKAPFKIQQLLTDNGKEFTDCFCATGERDPLERHRFAQTCEHHGIAHRLVKPRHPQTSGLGERCDGCIGEVLATTHFDAAERLEETLLRYVRLYNHQIPQKALRTLSPVQALKEWQEKRPELFMKQGI